MKINIFIDKEREEEVIVYAHEKNAIVTSIEKLVVENNTEFLGYKDGEVVKLELSGIYCFTVENNKIYAYTERDRFHIKQRLYKLEEQLPDNFIKLNQSCIGDINKIESFGAAFSGSLTVTFKNGYTDYVSRRNIKTVKERLGI